MSRSSLALGAAVTTRQRQAVSAGSSWVTSLGAGVPVLRDVTEQGVPGSAGLAVGDVDAAAFPALEKREDVCPAAGDVQL